MSGPPGRAYVLAVRNAGSMTAVLMNAQVLFEMMMVCTVGLPSHMSDVAWLCECQPFDDDDYHHHGQVEQCTAFNRNDK